MMLHAPLWRRWRFAPRHSFAKAATCVRAASFSPRLSSSGKFSISQVESRRSFRALVKKRLISTKKPWPKRKPPVIRLAERENFRFPSGSAALSQDFQGRLETDIFPHQILPALQQFGAVVDTIEIVGHTDGQALSSPVSNLDRWGVDALNRLLPLQSAAIPPMPVCGPTATREGAQQTVALVRPMPRACLSCPSIRTHQKHISHGNDGLTATNFRSGFPQESRCSVTFLPRCQSNSITFLNL